MGTCRCTTRSTRRIGNGMLSRCDAIYGGSADSMSVTVSPRYGAVGGWERVPAGYSHPDVAAVAVDSKDRVFLFCRSDHPVMIYERDGRFVGSWGEGVFTMRTHGITIAPDDSVWCTDDAGHSVRKFTPDGKLLLM